MIEVFLSLGVFWRNKMRCLGYAVVALVSLSTSFCQAGFLSQYTGESTNLPAFPGRTVRYTVWENDVANNANFAPGLGVTSNLGQFVYLYQVLSPADPSVGNLTVMVDGQTAMGAGVLDDEIFSPSASFDDASDVAFTNTSNVSQVTYAGNDEDGIYFNVTPVVSTKATTLPSEIMYVVSNGSPRMGELALGGIGPFNTSKVSAAVPVPLPATLGLVALGAPFVRVLRRRKA